ncbi:hypothetical protein B0J11DRAFT_585859 [Dendryphion nanum]|uniref:2EXR domain-containing protein n=1 Tax=Dendryphion nanum TaxID=256645 RepID=A0A9P9D2M1_9PLEO|nr:hypothetical protein B0J11DRAFT_585859 [Dendryphion nanum]
MGIKAPTLFTDLPLELRQEIYLIATPPRVVLVEEVLEDLAVFEERFETLSITKIQTHPGLDYFAEHFRSTLNGKHATRDLFPAAHDDIPPIYRGRSHLRQRKLEEYGFKSNKDPIPAWRYEDDMPLEVLCRNPKLAFQFFRHSRLKHSGPVPPLLHMSFESRAFLVSLGYQLAFGTRSHMPTTWFNFKRDILAINCAWKHEPFQGRWKRVDDEEFHGLLSGKDYHVGQFLPADLTRVRRLACEGWFPETYSYCCMNMRPVLQLFPQVRELFGVSWAIDECLDALEQAVLNLDLRWDTVDASCEWRACHRFISVEEIDTLWTTVGIECLEAYYADYEDDGIRALGLKRFKLKNGFSRPYLSEQALDCWQHKPLTTCSCPKIKFRNVHMVTEPIGQRILMHREAFVKHFELLKQQTGVPLQLPNDGRVDFNYSLSWFSTLFGEGYKTHQQEIDWWVRKGCPANSNTWRLFLDL